MKKLLSTSIITGALALVGVITSQAAIISWGPATQITGDTDVLNTKPIVGAFNVGDGGVSGATVNGVTFNPFALDSTSGPVSSGAQVSGGVTFTLATVPAGTNFASSNVFYGSGSNPFASLSANYQTLLSSATVVDGPSTFTLTMSGLQVGSEYNFQWWANYSAPGSQLHGATGVASGGSVTLNDNTTAVEGGLGQYAIGKFVADSSTQVLTFAGVPNTAGQFAMLNAFELAIPEPTTYLAGLLSAGACLVSFVRRRK